MNERPSRIRALAFRAGAAGLALVAGLAVAEIVLRVFDLAPPPALSTVTERDFERIPGIFAPGQRVTRQSGTAFEHNVTVDSLGFRGRDFPRAKPPGELRVLHVGDSFTFGHNVEDRETLPARLQQLLEERCGEATVINAGLSGSTILGQAAMIERGLSLEPDLVVLMYHENDLDELAFVRIWDQLAVNRRTKSTFPVSIGYHLARNTALGRVALQARASIQVAEANTRAEHPMDVILLDSTRVEYERRLAQVDRRLQAVGIPLLFVAFPHPSSVRRGRGGRDYDWVVTTAERLGIHTVDLLPGLSAAGAVEELYLLPLDYHPSPKGHELSAVDVADEVIGIVGHGACRARDRERKQSP